MARETYFDGLRGVAIIGVVSIHASTTGVSMYRSAGPGDFNVILAFAIGQVFLFAVPLFFLLSGYLMGRKAQRSGVDYRSIGRQLLSVVVPYAVWSLVVLWLHGQLSDLKLVAKDLVLGRALGPYYFVVALMVLWVVTPLLLAVARRSWFPAACVAVTIAHILAGYALQLTHPTLQWWWVMAPATGWIAYYGLGLSLGLGGLWLHRLVAIPTWAIATAAAVAALASIGEGLAWLAAFGDTGVSTTNAKLSSFAYALLCCVLAFRLRSAVEPPRWLVQLGRMSFGIFLVHEIFRAYLAQLVIDYTPLELFQPASIAAVVVLTILVCALLSFGSVLLLRGFSRPATGLAV